MKEIFALFPFFLLLSEISPTRLPNSDRGITEGDVSVQSAPNPSFWSQTRFELVHIMELGQMIITKRGELLKVYMRHKDILKRRFFKLRDIVRTEFMRSGLKFFKESSELADEIRDMCGEMNAAIYGTTSMNIIEISH